MTTTLLLCTLWAWQLCPIRNGVTMLDRCTPKYHGTTVQLYDAILRFDGPEQEVVYVCGEGE